MWFPFGRVSGGMRQIREEQIKEIKGRILKNHAITDIEFDQFYPKNIRSLSAIQWTPLKVIDRSLELLRLTSSDSVLDVGSGVGKFCIYASMKCDAKFNGIEKRNSLVEISNALRIEFNLKNVQFKCGDMNSVDWYEHSVFYFYNPFFESLRGTGRIDGTVPHGLKPFSKSIHQAKECLKRTKSGTKVITFHTMGGKLPKDFILIHKEYCVTGDLEYYIKQ